MKNKGKISYFVFLFLYLFVIIYGCGEGGSTSTDPLPAPTPATSLSANPTIINTGSSSVLSWSSTNSVSCSASWTTSTTTNGSQTVWPSATTSYSITCLGDGGSASANATVTVNSIPTPTPTVSLVANPANIIVGSSSVLSWSSTNSVSCSASWTTSTTTNGSQTVWPSATTSYSITCSGDGGSASDSKIVTVNSLPTPVPTVSLTANPTIINLGSSSVLTWSSTNTNSCLADWTASAAISGSQTVWPTATTSYSITCSGDGGSASANATVTVNQPINQPPTANANGPYTSDTATAVNFSSTGSFDSDGTIIGYQWDFEYDGINFTIDSVETNPIHNYIVAGTYTAALRVSDNQSAVSAIATTSASISDACVENPGIKFGTDGMTNNIGKDNIKTFGENNQYIIYTESNSTDTHSKLILCYSIDTEQPFICFGVPNAEFDHSGINGSIPFAWNIGKDGTINLVWWRLHSLQPSQTTFIKGTVSIVNGISNINWSAETIIPVGGIEPYSMPKLISSGNYHYLFDMPNFTTTKIVVNISTDNGATWQPATVVYENPIVSINFLNAEVDATGKPYVFFTESDGTNTYTSLATSIDQGATWNPQRAPATIDNIGLGYIVASNGTIYRLASPNFTVTEIQSMTNPETVWENNKTNWESSNWTTVITIPANISSKFDTYRLNLRNGGYTILGLGFQCNPNADGSIRPIKRADYVNGVWSSVTTVQALEQNGTTIPNFSGAETSGGIIYTMMQRNIIGGLCNPNCPTEIWLGKNP